MRIPLLPFRKGEGYLYEVNEDGEGVTSKEYGNMGAGASGHIHRQGRDKDTDAGHNRPALQQRRM